MDLSSGMLSLRDIYRYLWSERPLESKDITGTAPISRRCGEIAADLSGDIEPAQGFHLWGRYEQNEHWQNLYVGMGGHCQRTLRGEVKERLKDDRIAFWASLADPLKLLQQPQMQKYRKESKRALLRKSTTHIVWISSPDIPKDDMKTIKADLIECFNPDANIQRPAPNQTNQALVARIREEIHIHRNTMYDPANP